MRCFLFKILFAAVLLTLSCSNVNAQETVTVGNISLSNVFYFSIFETQKQIIEKRPNEGDDTLIKNNRNLVNAEPNQTNYNNYSDLAAALWSAGRVSEAKKMFLKIESSDKSFYKNSTFHSSGTTYEYGSYTSNFKNVASLYLMKIYLEEKKYDVALEFLIKADKLYKIDYNCGTGFYRYEDELKNYYAACYQGLGMYDAVIDLRLTETFYSDIELVKLLRRKYKQSEINRYLKLALDNTTIILDDLPSALFMKDVSGQDSLIANYHTGVASTLLFGRKVTLDFSRPEDGETLTREKVIKEFRESYFFQELYKD